MRRRRQKRIEQWLNGTGGRRNTPTGKVTPEEKMNFKILLESMSYGTKPKLVRKAKESLPKMTIAWKTKHPNPKFKKKKTNKNHFYAITR